MTIVTNLTAEETAKSLAAFKENTEILKEGRCGSRRIVKGSTWKWVKSFLSEDDCFDVEGLWSVLSDGDRELTRMMVHDEDYHVYFTSGRAVYYLSLPDEGGFNLQLIGPKERVLALNLSPTMFEPAQGKEFLEELKEHLDDILSGTDFRIKMHEEECKMGVFNAHWWADCDEMERLLDEAVYECFEGPGTLEYDFS